VANLLFIHTKATGGSATGFAPPCAAADTAAMFAGEGSIVRYRGRTTAGETSALVARCVL
jgi:hypothetical protein